MLGTHDSAPSRCGQRETRSGGFELEIMSIDPDTPASLRPELRPGMRLVELQRRPLPASSARPQALVRRVWSSCAHRLLSAGGDYRSVMEQIRERDTRKEFVLGFSR